MTWRFINEARLVAYRQNADGSIDSRIASEISDPIDDPLPVEKPAEEVENGNLRASIDRVASTPVSNLAEARDAIQVLAIAMQKLARRL
jgi:hypothetical protein